MKVKIFQKGKKWFASNGKHKIETTTTTETHRFKNKIYPIFRLTNELFEIFPWIREPLKKRFRENHVKRKISEFVESNCWITTFGCSANQGYIKVRFSFSKEGGFYVGGYAHMLSYLLFNGEIPKESTLHWGLKQVQHKCGKGCCANPDHLEIGMPRENANTAISQHVFAHYLNSSWKLETPQVCAIRYLYHERVFSVEVLSKIFGMSVKEIIKIAHYEVWQYVDMSSFLEDVKNQFKGKNIYYPPSVDEVLLNPKWGDIKRLSKESGIPEYCLYNRRKKLLGKM